MRVKDLRQRSGLAWFCARAETCVVFNTGPYTVLPDNSISITANMQSETGFPSGHQLKSYVASKSRLKLAAHCPVSRCWPSCYCLTYKWMSHVTVWPSPPHLINVATLPCESQNTQNVILQQDITKENCTRCHNFIKVDQGHHALKLLILGVIEQCVYETKIHHIDNLQKYLMQTWSDLDQDITDTAIDQWHDHLRSCVCWWRTF